MTRKIWKVGDTVGFCGDHRSCKRRPIVPGLFFYSGFGHGLYYGTDGKEIWTTTSQVYALAQADGLREYIYLDSFSPSSERVVAVSPRPEPILDYVI